MLHGTGSSYKQDCMMFPRSKKSGKPEILAGHCGDQGLHQLAAFTEQAPQDFHAGVHRAMIWLAC